MPIPGRCSASRCSSDRASGAGHRRARPAGSGGPVTAAALRGAALRPRSICRTLARPGTGPRRSGRCRTGTVRWQAGAGHGDGRSRGGRAVPAEIRGCSRRRGPEAPYGVSLASVPTRSAREPRLLEQVNARRPRRRRGRRLGSRLGESGHVLDGFEARLTPGPDTCRKARPRGPWCRSAWPRRPTGSATPPVPVVAEAAAAGQRRLRLVLVPVDGRWRIQEILRPPG